MKIPLILEKLYLATATKKVYASGAEDFAHASEDLIEISKFFSVVSVNHRNSQVRDLTDKRLQRLLKAYGGPCTRKVRVRFIEENVG